MLISNLIYELSQIQAEHGNIEVWQSRDEEGNGYGRVCDPGTYIIDVDDEPVTIAVLWPAGRDDIQLYNDRKEYDDVFGDQNW
jgi:hypothetical protein